ncbi:MAG: DinB family protein [Aquabacterium sp.]
MNALTPWNLRDYALTMARYNQWMNGKLYDAAAELSDEQRKADRGAFFRSVHGTLNHLLLADRTWMQRLHGEPITMTSADQEVHSDFPALRAARQEMDDRLIAWAAGLEAVEPGRPYTFTSVTYQKEISLPYVVVVMQVFNHQTHHRGQITTLLNQFGIDIGPTDLPVMPR